MSRHIRIESCHDCPHLDHDGGLRQGGAYRVCGLMKVSDEEAENQEGVRRRRLNPDAPPCDTSRANIRAFDGTIPSWCPLEKETG